MNQPAQENWRDVIPETENLLQAVKFVGKKIIAEYLVNAQSSLVVYDHSREDSQAQFVQKVDIPIGSVKKMYSEKNHLIYTFSSFSTPNNIYKLNLDTFEQSLIYQTPLGLLNSSP